MKKRNPAAMAGFILCFSTILYGIATNGGLSAIVSLIHIPSAIVTFGGAFCAILTTSDSFADFLDCIQSFALAFRSPDKAPEEISKHILDLAEIARREGLLALEEQAEGLSDEFLKKGVMLVVDGTDPEMVRSILETDMVHKEANDKRHVRFWQDLGAFGPAWGMVGTLLGLINMMRNMGGDASAIGSGMSLALITTLYGSILANWICIPIGRKLEKYADQKVLNMEICVEGLLSIQAGENPRVILEKIKSVIELKLEEDEAA